MTARTADSGNSGRQTQKSPLLVATTRLPAYSPFINDKDPPMTKAVKPYYSLRVQPFDDNNEPSGLPITVTGRECWTLRKLIDAGAKGVSSLDNIGPRVSHYVFKLRGYGLAIETIHEKHGGDFPGTHARYRLHAKVTILEVSDRRAA